MINIVNYKMLHLLKDQNEGNILSIF